jgi:flagellar protein FliL
MANRVENQKTAPAEKPPTNGAPETNGNGHAAAVAPAAGIKTYIPLIANLVLMPVLAYVMTAFVLVPKLAKKTGGGAEPAAEAASNAHGAESAHGKSEGGESKDPVTGKTKISVPLSKKTLVNVSGTMGTRYLLAEFILVGTGANFKSAIEKADAELRDAAASALSSKTISDLEKPGIRNLVRTELITLFNSILGKGAVSEIYLTEFAIQ